jgi:hypothetical protein
MAERQCFTGSSSKVIARRRDVETEERELNLNRRRVFGDGIGVLNNAWRPVSPRPRRVARVISVKAPFRLLNPNSVSAPEARTGGHQRP